MAGRYPTVAHFSFCYEPKKISKNGLTMYVPCGKCNGCLLQKSNSWSFRLGDEIECSENAIFFTLTYSNRYVPKMYCSVENGEFHWRSYKDNVRFNGRFDVPREPLDFYSKFTLKAPLKNYGDDKCIGYLCKSDIQLWLKLLRKDIYEHYNISSGSFRYFIIGEYGPGKSANQGKFRPHYHGIIFPCNGEVASYLLSGSLYKNWKMCDYSLFEQYTKFCDSGIRHYVTEYLTSTTFLPTLLSQEQEVKPFRLSSKKAGVIGRVRFDTKKVLQDIERGVDEYHKQVDRIERNYIFLYPPSLINSLFPKCRGFRIFPPERLYWVYGHLFEQRQDLLAVPALLNGLAGFSVQDYKASKACLKACDLMNWTPCHYVDVLVQYYYRKDMRLLRYQYEWQQQNIDNPYKCMAWYSNIFDYLDDSDFNIYDYPLSASRIFDSRLWFIQSFGFTHVCDEDIKKYLNNDLYRSEVDTIVELSDKSKKINSLTGLDPYV